MNKEVKSNKVEVYENDDGVTFCKITDEWNDYMEIHEGDDGRLSFTISDDENSKEVYFDAETSIKVIQYVIKHTKLDKKLLFALFGEINENRND